METTMNTNIAQPKKWLTRDEPSAFDVLNIVNKEHPEYELMWKKLGEHKLNKNIEKPTLSENCGEVWQYMHTDYCSYLFFWKRQCHYFRHRYHPVCNERVDLVIPASRKFCKQK